MNENETENEQDGADDELTLDPSEAGGTGADVGPVSADAPDGAAAQGKADPGAVLKKMRDNQVKRTQVANAGRRIITQRAIKVGKGRVIPANTDVTDEAKGWGNLAFMLRQGTVIAVDGSGALGTPVQQARAKVLADAPPAPPAPPAAPPPPAKAKGIPPDALAAIKALTPQDTADHVRRVVQAAGIDIPEGASKAKMLSLVKEHLSDG